MYNQTIMSFDGKRSYPWEIAGKHVESDDLIDALHEAQMSNWDVRKEPIYAESGVLIPGKFATTRVGPDEGRSVLGVVGNRYSVHQNEEAFEPIKDILDSSDLEIATAGFKNNGNQAFVCMKIPKGIDVGGDVLDAHLLAVTSHDGSLAMTYSVMVGRLACFNALRPSLDTPRKFAIRHTSAAGLRVLDVRSALQLTFSYIDDFSLEMNKWLDASISDYSFDVILNRLIPDKPWQSEGRRAAISERKEIARSLWAEANTTEYGRGTAYGAYNALNEFSNWYMPIRANEAQRDVSRAERTLDDDGIVAKFDARAEELILQYASHY